VSGPGAEPDLGFDPRSLEPLPVDVVSVQSQVVYGCVGNSVAVPTLQALGLNVVPVPTVLLSNTPHYDTLAGGAVPLDWFEGYLRALDERRVLRHARAVLVGYLGSPTQAAALAAWLERATRAKPELLVVLDPVMGDFDSGLYVDPQLPAALRDRLVPHATGLTPNAFEFEQLIGRPLATVAETVAAARGLLEGRTQWVVVTSAAPQEDGGGSRIVLVTSSGHEVVTWERVAYGAKGTGDLFTAAVTGALLQGADLRDAVVAAHARVATVLERTARLNCNELVLTDA